ncbi:hypothetical protein GQ42DRAFT_165859 [Ramicandelaber brevisporus]|nr:hypothetical protein GQ42DRAFT_165859 [Ramicandelaber brevisporus]
MSATEAARARDVRRPHLFETAWEVANKGTYLAHELPRRAAPHRTASARAAALAAQSTRTSTTL